MTILPNLTRREFVAKAGRSGAALALAPLAFGEFSEAHAARRTGVQVISREPPAPRTVRRYVTRPDLRPVGVSVRSTSSFRASAPARGYIFCAPKSPRFASPPGSDAPPTVVFPVGADPGLMIIDTAGDLVWFKPLRGPHEIPFNFRVQSYNGQRVLTWFQGRVTAAHGRGHYVLADRSYTPFAQVDSTRYPADLHEFIVTGQGTALHTAYESRSRGRRPRLLIGHAQEVDIATNELLFDWSSYPRVGTRMAYVKSHDGYFDYFHINSIGLWPGSARDLLISARNTCTVYLVDRRTSKIKWRLGGKRSDFRLGQRARFYYQHDARALSDGSGVRLFDDASRPSPETFASGKVLTLNRRARTASLRRRFIHSDGRFITPSQGNLQLLPNGSHVVGWGYFPFFSTYARSGALDAPLVLDGRFPAGAASYRTFLFDWVGRPLLEELRLVVRHTVSPGRVRVYVSWNGATEVASWQLRAGRDRDSLRRLVTVPKRGFETTFTAMADRAQYFTVVALGRKGAVLGESGDVVLQ